ncbi:MULTISPECIES: LysM domain-containing protein, partial [Enterobacterales]|uniref:LysM peptidoglycan-binding domain-containing protein n=1 Tax=Enterobacterales TaxID=91347 RepID=UPI002EDB4BAE
LTPLFDAPQDAPTPYDGLLGWSGEWKCYLDQQNKPVPLDDIESLSPEEETVIVCPGDTLGRIAKEHYCTVKKLAAFNGIRNPSLIHPGQIIRIPPVHYSYPEEESVPDNTQCTLTLHFEDLIEKPIAGLKVKIVTALGDVYESVTDGMGKIAEFTTQAETELKILASSATGKIKEVASFTPLAGKVAAIISSPKVRVKGKSIPLKGPAGNVGNGSGKVNNVSVGRDSQGGPRIHIDHICPNNYDLMLNKNIIYWDQIIAASERSGIIPQCIAAVINAEAAKERDGVWKPTSVCINSAISTEGITVYKSSAAGMTQFLNGTWMSETFREGTYLYEQASSQGLIADVPLFDKKGQPVNNKQGEIITTRKFQIAPDIWESLQGLRKKHFITGVTPYPHRATTSLQQWLNLRFEPEYAIMAAVDYGVANLT